MLTSLYVPSNLARRPLTTNGALTKSGVTDTSRINKPTIIRLKWGDTEYHGTLVSVDSYMNAQMRDTKEYQNGKFSGNLGEVLFRCNNILWFRAGGDGDAEMDG